MDSFWLKVLQWGIWFVLMLGFWALVAKARKRDLEEYSDSEMRMPTYVLLVGLVEFVFLVGIAIFSNLFPNETVTPVTTSAFLLFSSLGALLVYIYFVQRHKLNDSHIVFTSVFGVQTKVAWNEISAVNYSAGLQWFIVETADRKRYHFSEIMKGIRQFSWSMLEKVGRSKISQKAIGPLERFKAGRLD